MASGQRASPPPPWRKLEGRPRAPWEAGGKQGGGRGAEAGGLNPAQTKPFPHSASRPGCNDQRLSGPACAKMPSMGQLADLPLLSSVPGPVPARDHVLQASPLAFQELQVGKRIGGRW